MTVSQFDKNLPLYFGADHAGFSYKTFLMETAKLLGWQVVDKGTYSEDSTDYPDHAHPVATAVENTDAAAGILICGSGNGVCMTANKHAGVRAALCWTEELAALARQHNNANVLCIPARFVDEELAKKMLITFLETSFEGGRHERRVHKIAE